MSKSVLVIDTPETCSECVFCNEFNEGIEAYCFVTDDDKDKDSMKEINCKDGYCQGKPAWCPLKPLPEKKEYVDPISSAKAKKILLQLVGTLVLMQLREEM